MTVVIVPVLQTLFYRKLPQVKILVAYLITLIGLLLLNNRVILILNISEGLHINHINIFSSMHFLRKCPIVFD